MYGFYICLSHEHAVTTWPGFAQTMYYRAYVI